MNIFMWVFYIMNLKKLCIFQLFSAIFAMFLGTILHFTYQWSGNNTLVGFFSAVNESTWEHLKLAFFPMLISCIVGYFIFNDKFPSFLCSKILGIFVSMSFIIVFFYTYTGIIGTNYASANILSFFIAILLGEYVTYKLTLNNIPCNKHICIIILIILVTLFILFTFNPPKINLFKDPRNNSYVI